MRLIKFNLLLFTLSIIALSGCTKEKSSVNIQLQPTFGTESFNINQWYQTATGDSLRFSKLKLYLSEITLLDNSGKSTTIKDIAYFNLTDGDPSILSTKANNLKSGSYKKVALNFGLTPSQNNTDPATVSCPNPLCADNDMWWGSTLKYTNVKLEGSSKIAPSFTQNIFLYHVGKDENFRSYQFTKEITLSENKTSDLIIKLDLKELLKDFNMSTENITQTTDKPVIATKFADKFGNAISIL